MWEGLGPPRGLLFFAEVLMDVDRGAASQNGRLIYTARRVSLQPSYLILSA